MTSFRKTKWQPPAVGGGKAPAVQPKVRLRRNGSGRGLPGVPLGGRNEHRRSLQNVPGSTRDLTPSEAPDQVRGREAQV